MHKGISFGKLSESMEEEPGEEVHFRQERDEDQISVDTTHAWNSSQVSETCPFKFVNTAENFVRGKVQFTFDAWKELTLDNWILDMV